MLAENTIRQLRDHLKRAVTKGKLRAGAMVALSQPFDRQHMERMLLQMEAQIDMLDVVLGDRPAPEVEDADRDDVIDHDPAAGA